MNPEQIREALDMFDVDLYPEIAEAARAYADLLDRGHEVVFTDDFYRMTPGRYFVAPVGEDNK